MVAPDDDQHPRVGSGNSHDAGAADEEAVYLADQVLLLRRPPTRFRSGRSGRATLKR
jgi:hypothetical protein